MLAVHDLHVAYGESEVLHGINLDVGANEIVAIMGRNGMGKTTLMKSLMGIAPQHDRSRRPRHLAPEELPARRARCRLRTAGPDDLLHHDGAGKHRDGVDDVG